MNRTDRLLSARTACGCAIREADNAFDSSQPFYYAIVCVGCGEEIDKAQIDMEAVNPGKGWFRARDDAMYGAVLAHRCPQRHAAE